MIDFFIKLKRLRCALFCNKPLRVTHYEKVKDELIMFATCPTCGLDYIAFKDKEK